MLWFIVQKTGPPPPCFPCLLVVIYNLICPWLHHAKTVTWNQHKPHVWIYIFQTMAALTLARWVSQVVFFFFFLETVGSCCDAKVSLRFYLWRERKEAEEAGEASGRAHTCILTRPTLMKKWTRGQENKATAEWEGFASGNVLLDNSTAGGLHEGVVTWRWQAEIHFSERMASSMERGTARANPFR